MLSIIFQFLLACATSASEQPEPSEESVVPISTGELNSETNDANLPAVEEAKSPPPILTVHKTIAVFNGFRITSLCTSLTADCPYKCGNTTEEAFFTILEYTDDTPDESTGVTKKDSISFSVHALPKSLRDNLTLEDKVRLHWTEESPPDDPQKDNAPANFLSSFKFSSNKLHHIECLEECGQGETSRCFTCNPDLDGNDFEKLVEMGLATRQEAKISARDLKYYLKIDVYKDTGPETIPKDDYETLGINKQLTKARALLKNQLSLKLERECFDKIDLTDLYKDCSARVDCTKKRLLGLEFDIIDTKVNSITVSKDETGTQLQECFSQNIQTLKLRTPYNLKVRLSISIVK